ncbi:hypothetical protein PQR01_00415 [Paraburkholderia rhynchosiae]|uniref:Uncharacterized protein n=1 Tax=Paraburkholderia rhynchosiae TaxID=487049 RepID=A0ACC7N2Y6_9BURK
MNLGLIGFPEATKVVPPLASSASVTSATTVKLTSASASCQSISMTAPNQVVLLPDERTIQNSGIAFLITNAGQYPFAVQDASGLTVALVPIDGSALCISSGAGAAGGNWSISNASVQFPLQTVIQTSTPSVVTSSVIAAHAIAPLTATTALYAYSTAAGQPVYAVVLTANPSGVAVGTAVSTGILAGPSGYSPTISLGVLSPTSVIMSANQSGSPYLPTTMVLTISGTTVTAGTSYPCGATSASAGASIAVLSPTSALLAWVPGGTTAGVISFAVATISGTAVSYGATSTISNNVSQTGILLAALSPTSVVAVFNYTTAGNPVAVPLTISGAAITVGSITNVLSGANAQLSLSCLVALSALTALAIIADGNSMPRTVLVSVSGNVATASSSLPVGVRGLTLTNGLACSATSSSSAKAMVGENIPGNSTYGPAVVPIGASSQNAVAVGPVSFTDPSNTLNTIGSPYLSAICTLPSTPLAIWVYTMGSNNYPAAASGMLLS